jgi:hypothetical protein
MLIKKAPSSPPMIPMRIAAGSKNSVFTSLVSLRLPNFNAEPDQLPWRFPLATFSKNARKKVVNAHDKNTFQIIENLQNVFGLDIS